jgi:glycosyltransferase involved in cell wall biosynthesis
MALTVLLVISLIFIGVQVMTLLVNLVTFPVLQTGAVPASKRVSLLIPARNEAKNLSETLAGFVSQPADEVIFLDDDSSDATPELLAAAAQTHARVQVISGAPLPPGWSGKNWACHQLARAARGDILIFTDADVYWQPQTLEALLAFQQREQAEFVSVWPRQLTMTLIECLTVPVIDLILLGSLPYVGVRHLPFAAFSAGNGQLMLWTRKAYDRIGGHAAFYREVLEDVRMGQAAKGAGLRVALALGGDVIATRMYRSGAELLEGFSKNVLAAAGNNPLALIALTLLNILVHTVSWLLGLVNPWFWLVAGLSLLQRFLTNWKTGRSPAEVWLQPLMSYPLSRIVLRALAQRGSYSWKGRRYS